MADLRLPIDVVQGLKENGNLLVGLIVTDKNDPRIKDWKISVELTQDVITHAIYEGFHGLYKRFKWYKVGEDFIQAWITLSLEGLDRVSVAEIRVKCLNYVSKELLVPVNPYFIKSKEVEGEKKWMSL